MAGTKRGLGRGFDSLIPTQLVEDEFDVTAAPAGQAGGNGGQHDNNSCEPAAHNKIAGEPSQSLEHQNNQRQCAPHHIWNGDGSGGP